MIVSIERMYQRSTGIIGMLRVNTVPTVFYSLEHPPRAEKIQKKTGIPLGKYQLLPRREGQVYENYCQRFGCDHPIIWLQDVPGFEYIYIHIGNKVEESEGCILVGSAFRELPNDAGWYLTASKIAYLALHKLISDAWLRKEEVHLNIWKSYAK